MKKERRNQIVRSMFQSGYSDEEIAQELAMTKGHINKIKRELGLTVKRRRPEDDADAIVELFEQGFDRDQIAEKIGWSKGTVNIILKDRGYGRKVIEPEPLPVPVRRKVKAEKVVIHGKVYWDVTPFFLNMEGDSIWMST